jgi:hypothetical protein
MPSKDLDEKKLSKYKKTFAKLSWRILEMKFLYYEGSNHGLANMIPSDSDYDFLEDKYKKLAKILKVKPTASDHVGFPRDTPSGRLVANHMITNKGKSKITLKFKR